MFFDRLKEICEKRKTTPTAVAESIGISRSNVTEWKHGKYPKVETLIKIADFLDVEPAVFIPSKKNNQR